MNGLQTDTRLPANNITLYTSALVAHSNQPRWNIIQLSCVWTIHICWCTLHDIHEGVMDGKTDDVASNTSTRPITQFLAVTSKFDICCRTGPRYTNESRHFFLFWFTTLHTHNFLSLSLPAKTYLIHKSYSPRSFTSSSSRTVSTDYCGQATVARSAIIVACKFLWRMGIDVGLHCNCTMRSITQITG